MKKKLKFGKIISLLLILTLVGVLIFQVFTSSGLGKTFGILNNSTKGFDFFGFVSGGVKVKGEDVGRTNILIYGVNEQDGDGTGPVDTNIVMSYFHNEKKLSTISIMRDIDVSGYGKINAIYPTIANNGKDEGKSDDAIDADYDQEIGSILDLKIDYHIKLNMSAVEKLINKVDGIDVDIPQSFYDTEYPRDGYESSNSLCPKQVISNKIIIPANYNVFECPVPNFTKGNDKLNGKRALQYARSRHGICYDESGSGALGMMLDVTKMEMMQEVVDNKL